MENKQILICPDSFKGTLTAEEIADTIEKAIKDVSPAANTRVLPIADGGEGTLECFRRALTGRLISVRTRNSNFRPCTAEYLLSPVCAIVESAKAIGLASTEFKNPAKTTSYGVGVIIDDALMRTKDIVLALGGSSTNDGGAGIAAALGVKFFDKSGETFIPTGGTLKNIEKIDVKNAQKFNLTCMCDVDNPLCGETGASYVFAPQKGADYMMVKDLDDGLKHYASVIKRDVGVDVENLKGGGAAGGIAAGMVAFFNAKLTSGIDVMLDGTGFDSLLKDAAFVVTGEGKLDNQTLDGKAISGLTRHAKKFGVPVIAICGQIAMGFDLEKSGLALATATSPENTPLLPSRNYKQELYDAAVKLFKNLLEKKS